MRLYDPGGAFGQNPFSLMDEPSIALSVLNALTTNETLGWIPSYKVPLVDSFGGSISFDACTLTLTNALTGGASYGPSAGTPCAAPGGLQAMNWPGATSLPAGTYSYAYAATLNGTAQPVQSGTVIISNAVTTTESVTDISGSAEQVEFLFDERRPLIFTFSAADGTSPLTLSGTPTFELIKCYSPGAGIAIEETNVSTIFGSGTTSVQASYDLDTADLLPGDYLAFCTANLTGPDGLARTIVAQSQLSILPGLM